MTNPRAKWNAMLARCYNQKSINFKDYGGRGITVCEEWRNSFDRYIADMGPSPGPDYSVDRVDNNLGYFKENCRWATHIEQANNKRNNRIIEFAGEKMSLANWGRKSGIDCETIAFRLKVGWLLEDAISRKITIAKSGVPCVSFRPERGNWVVRITRDKRRITIGTYSNFFEAVCGKLGNDFKTRAPKSLRCNG